MISRPLDKVVLLLAEMYRAALASAVANAEFEPKDLVDLASSIAAMNAFNRLSAPSGLRGQARP